MVKLSKDKLGRLLNKILDQNKGPAKLSREEKVSRSTIQKLKNKLPLFFWHTNGRK
jgi:hypothetical protein